MVPGMISFLLDLGAHLSWLMHWAWHTHRDLPPSHSSLGLTHSPCFPSLALGLWHQELLCSTCSSCHMVGKVTTLCGWPFWQGTLSICHVTAEPLPQVHHHTCPTMTPWLVSHILKMTFVVIRCKATLYLQHLAPCFSHHYLCNTMKLIVSRNLIVWLLFSIWPLVQNVHWKNNTKIEKLKTK